MFRSLFLFTGIVASLFLASLAGAEPVRVAVIDAPVDYGNADITPYLDHETLNRIRLHGGQVLDPGTGDGATTLGEYNAEAMARAVRTLNPELYREQVRVLDLLTRHSAGHEHSKEDKRFLRSVRLKLQFDRRYREQLNTLGTALHGTHVAGMVVDQLDPDQVRLITYPFLEVDRESARGRGRRSVRERLLTSLVGNGCRLGVVCAPQGVVVDFLKRNAIGLLQGLMAAVTDPKRLEAEVRQNARQHYGELSRVIQQGQVQVANMSLGFGVSMSLESALGSVGLLSRVLFREAITRMITTVMRVQQEELRRFFEENPNTIFVVAAGNDGVDVAREGDYHSAAVSGPNVVNVAATDFNGRLAEFSNVSRQEIEIAAPGVVVRSALVGAHDSRARVAMSGTSMATPIVTNRLVQILSENPGMGPQEAIHVLLEQHTGIIPELERSVAGGRWMLPRGLVGSVSGTIESIEGVTQESYMDADACRRALEVSPEGRSIRPLPAPGTPKSLVLLFSQWELIAA